MERRNIDTWWKYISRLISRTISERYLWLWPELTSIKAIVCCRDKIVESRDKIFESRDKLVGYGNEMGKDTKKMAPVRPVRKS